MGTPPTPNFLSEGAATFRGRLVNDSTACIVRPALVVYSGLHVLGKGLSAGIKLARPSSFARSRHRQAQPGIARLTEPAEIPWSIVPFVPVPVIRYQEPL